MRFVDADVARSVRQANRIQNVSITKNTCTYLYVYLHKTFLERNETLDTSDLLDRAAGLGWEAAPNILPCALCSLHIL